MESQEQRSVALGVGVARLVGVALLVSACAPAAPSGEAVDAPAVVVDVDATSLAADAPLDGDDNTDACALCAYRFCPDHAFCEAPAALSPVAPLRAQDTAVGARGDCALSGSGLGVRNLYYAFEVPAGALAEVVLTPTSDVEHGGPMLRVIASCRADSVEALNRVPRDDGTTALCMINPVDAANQVVLLAISDYHEGDMTYDLALTVHESTDACRSSERFRLGQAP